jgi:hypothetical protein
LAWRIIIMLRFESISVGFKLSSSLLRKPQLYIIPNVFIS